MSRPRRSETSTILLALALATLASACIQPKDPGVAINKIQARLVFGVKEETAPPPSPVEAVKALDTSAVIEEFVPEDDFELPPIRTKKPENPCPELKHGAAVKVPSGTTVPVLPPEGVFIWRYEKAVTNASGQAEIVQDRFVQRVVRRAKQVSETVFTYEIVEPGPNETTIVTTYQVKQERPPVAPPTPPVEVVQPPRGSVDPERGLVMKRRVVLDATGSESPDYRVFDPQYGLLILPLPATPAENFSTTSTDRRSGDTYFAFNDVISTKRINACGEPVEGWEVRSSQSFTRADASAQEQVDPRNPQISYVVATQYGGLIVSENVAVAGDTGTQEYHTLTLASLTPLPLPDSLK